MTDQRDPIDELLVSLSLSDGLGDVYEATQRFLRVTGRPCPGHSPAPYDENECCLCGIEGEWDQESETFTPSDDGTGESA